MINIRTVTVFAEPGIPIDRDVIARAGRVAADLRTALHEAGFTVQTTRFASVPFADLVGPEHVVDFTREGDPVRFDFPFFAPSRVIDPRAYGLDGLMWNTGRVAVAPRRPGLGVR